MSNPLENIFDLEPGSTPIFNDLPGREGEAYLGEERAKALIDPTSGEIVERTSTPLPTELDKEERLEDLHIDSQLETIHGSAMVAFEKSSRMAEEVDPKFAARNAEVAAQYLNIALNAVNSRVDAKFKRQKVRLAREGTDKTTTTNNNVIVADRNDLLQQIFGGNKTVTIEAEK